MMNRTSRIKGSSNPLYPIRCRYVGPALTGRLTRPAGCTLLHRPLGRPLRRHCRLAVEDEGQHDADRSADESELLAARDVGRRRQQQIARPAEDEQRD